MNNCNFSNIISLYGGFAFLYGINNNFSLFNIILKDFKFET